MGNHRKPPELAIVEGRHLQHPERVSSWTAPPTDPLGEAPGHITGTALEAWNCFVQEIPWLRASDRAVLESVSILRGRLMSGEDVSVRALTELRLGLSALGATPTTRSKVMAERRSDDPAEEFLN